MVCVLSPVFSWERPVYYQWFGCFIISVSPPPSVIWTNPERECVCVCVCVRDGHVAACLCLTPVYDPLNYGIICMILYTLKGYFTSGKMDVYLKRVIYVEEMWNYFCIWSFLDWEKPENVSLAYVDERLQLPECTCFTALGGHAYR